MSIDFGFLDLHKISNYPDASGQILDRDGKSIEYNEFLTQVKSYDK